MKITSIALTGVRGFKERTEFDVSENINLFIGKNNSGKSTILKSIYRLQNADCLTVHDTTPLVNEAKVELRYKGTIEGYFKNETAGLFLSTNLSHWTAYLNNGENLNIGASLPYIEPHNLIIPFLSNRKVDKYEESISEGGKKAVLSNFKNLYLKLDELLTYPPNSNFITHCNEIIGFIPTMQLAGNGKKVVQRISEINSFELTKLGDGIPNILGLLIDLTTAKNKIFIIEELENDLHPTALKKLLDLIIKASDKNQFFISTHSNIVLKQLGCDSNTKIFHISNIETDSSFKNLYLSRIKEIVTPVERRVVLEELGYEFSDYGLWQGWLILEEASTETLINKYLIPLFAPKLQGKLRTFSSGGYTNIKKKFTELRSTFVFLHLQPVYTNKIWVLLDGGESEKEVLNELINIAKNNNLETDRFNQLSKHHLEEYYPEPLIEKANQILRLENSQKKQEAKQELLSEFCSILDQDINDGREILSNSFNEIINYLRLIENKI